MDFLIESQIKVYPTVGDFPATGAVKTLYIDESTSTTYYWTGSAYSEIRTEAKYEAIDVLNGTGSSQPKMTVCYLKTSSSSANTPEILLSNANSEATSSKTIGLLLATIANGATGKLITSGEFDKFDTSAYNVGDRLWLSTTDGQMTTTVPSSPNHAVFIGIVTRKQSQNGRILVAIQNGYELQELHNVSIATPTDGQALMYEAVTQLWKNKTISTGITIGTTAITSGTVGRVLFEGTGNVVQESANLFWDNTNGRLGIGTSSPLQSLDIVTSSITSYPRIRTTSTASNTDVGLRFQDGTTGTGNGDGLYIGRASAINYLWTYEAEPLAFGANNLERMRIVNTGNVLINTTTDAGFKLDINGTLRVVNSASTGTAFTATNTLAGGIAATFNTGNGGSVQFTNGYIESNSLQFRISTNGTQPFVLMTQGTERMRLAPTTGNLLINTTTDAGFRLDVNGTARVGGSSFFATGTATGGNGVNIGTQSLGTIDINQRILQVDAGLYPTIIVNANNVVKGTVSANGFSSVLSMFVGTITNHPLSFSTNDTSRMRLTTTGNLLINTTTDVASSKLTIESTTQGFLPPRMTTTQKNAIASPATGLVVYDTTLNKLCVYTTTWETITSL